MGTFVAIALSHNPWLEGEFMQEQEVNDDNRSKEPWPSIAA